MPRHVTGRHAAHRRGLTGCPAVPPAALRLAAVGAGNAEIAAEMGIGVATVKAYLHSAMRRLGVRNRMRAVLVARGAGLP